MQTTYKLIIIYNIAIITPTKLKMELCVFIITPNVFKQACIVQKQFLHVQVGTTIAYVSVQDADSGAAGRVTCYLSDTAFTLQQVEVGEYRLLNRLTFDREVQ
jgi:hypothetical protein